MVPDRGCLWENEGGRGLGGTRRTLMTSARPFASSRFGREARKATSIKMYSGCQKAPIRFFPRGVSIAVLPPMDESTMARREVGICTKRTPRMLERVRRARGRAGHVQGGCDVANEIADDTASEGEEDGAAGALLGEEKVLDGGLALAGLCCLAGGDDMGDEAGCGGRIGERVADVRGEGVGEEGEVERGDVGVGDEDVCVCGEGGEEGLRDVRVEVEAAVDGVLAEDGDRVEGHV